LSDGETGTGVRAPRKRHVGLPLFAVLMCRKFASVAALSWHLPHHKNAAEVSVPAGIYLSERLMTAISSDIFCR
jgi:hypothetical protein